MDFQKSAATTPLRKMKNFSYTTRGRYEESMKEESSKLLWSRQAIVQQLIICSMLVILYQQAIHVIYLKVPHLKEKQLTSL